MNISIEYLKNGGEVDMPMLPGEQFTSKAIRFKNGRYELYDFKTDQVVRHYYNLNDLVKVTNRMFNMYDDVEK